MVRHLYDVSPHRLGYRQRQDGDIWHFCSNCSGWPRLKFIEQWVEPTNGNICSECEQRRREGSCRSDILRVDEQI
jgi:hypothetical protein